MVTPVSTAAACDPIHLCQGNDHGFLAEHVFASLGGLHGPFGMERVGQGDVDSVDVGVGQQRFVAAKGPGNALFTSIGFGLGQRAAGDCNKLAARRLLQWADQGSVDFGGGQ